MKDDNYKVSAIITTHNRLELLIKAINSVLNQTYENIELIIVDDNSTDGTRTYIQKLLLENKDISYIYISPDDSKGGNYARNLGINAASGEYIAFLDDDDEWLVDKIQKQINFLKDKSKCCNLIFS